MELKNDNSRAIKKFLSFLILILMPVPLMEIQIVAEENNSLDNLLEFSLEDLSNVQSDTATRTPLKLNQIPATIRIITDEQIKDRGYLSLEEALADLPGFQFRNIQGFNSYTFARGLPNQNNLILLMIDGVQINELNSGGFYGGLQHDLINVRRIEVIYGSASSLYGTNAVSGIINIITYNAKDFPKQSNRSFLQMGSWNSYKVAFAHSDYFTESDIGYSIAVSKSSTDKDDLSGNDGDNNWTDQFENFEDDWSFNSKLNYGQLDLGLLVQDKQASRTTNDVSSETNRADFGTNWHIRFTNLWGKHNYQLAANKWLKSSIYYRETTVQDDTIANIVLPENEIPGSIEGRFRPGEMWGIDEHLYWEVKQQLSIVLGAVFEKEHLSKSFSKSFAEYPSTPEPANEPDRVYQQLFSLYFHADYELSTLWNLSLGHRYDDSNSYGRVNTPSAAIVYNNYPLTLKLMYKEAFRAPKPWDFTFGTGNASLQPETMKSFETYLSYHFNKNVILEASLFNNKVSSLLAFDPEQQHWINEGNLSTQGIELNSEIYSQDWKLYFNYSYTDSKDDNDEQVAEISRHTANSGLEYFISENITLTSRLSYLGKRKNPSIISATNNLWIDAAWVVSLDLSLRDYTFADIHLSIKNLFDEEYYHSSNRPVSRYRQPGFAIFLQLEHSF